MADKETISDWGVCLSRHLQVLAASFPDCFPPDCVAKLRCNCFYSGLPKCLKAMVVYLKANPQEKTYSSYLQAAREAEKEDSMKLSQSPQSQATDNATKPRMTSFILLWKLKGTQPAVKTPTMCLVHLEEERSKKDKEVESADLTALTGSLRNSWYTLQGLWKTPRQRRSVVIIVAVWSASSVTAPW